MKTIFVSGAYRSNEPCGVKDNIDKAEMVAVKLWREGWAVLCPHLNTALFDQNYPFLPEEVYLKGYLEILSRFDAIFMLKNWQLSDGACAELNLAEELNMEVIYE